MGARARVGSLPEGPGGRLGLVSGALASGKGSFRGLDFGKEWRIAITPQGHISHKGFLAKVSRQSPA